MIEFQVQVLELLKYGVLSEVEVGQQRHAV
jgi:hypothetical protein